MAWASKRRALRGAAMAAVLGAGVAVGVLVGAATTTVASGAPVAYKVVTKDVTVGSGSSRVVDLTCPKGLVPTGGGAHYQTGGFSEVSSDAYVAGSDVDPSGRGWASALIVTPAQGSSSFTVNVVCADI